MASPSATALIVVDVQVDFCPGGALAVPDGNAIVPLINGLMERFDTVVLTQDWHPSGHISFASSHPGKAPFETIQLAYGRQVLWPDHCVQGHSGAAFHPMLQTDRANMIVRKGFRRGVDSYSGFQEADRETATGLGGYLRERGVKQVLICGLATDFCVAWTARDARTQGFDVGLVEDACRAIDTQGSLAAAWADLDKVGVGRLRSTAL